MRRVPIYGGLVIALVAGAVVMGAAPQAPAVTPAPPPGQFSIFEQPRHWPSDAAMHGFFVEKFRHAVGLGAARMSDGRLRVAPQMWLDISAPSDEGASDSITLRYALNSVELIGIARHATPVAFVVGRHGESTSTRERGLTDFERTALRTLRDGQEVVTRTRRNERLVVGAVRATEEGCIRCHAGAKPGDLLGALSYRLTRTAVTTK